MFDREELDLIYESLEITYQTMDRPEAGTPERLEALMAKVTGLLATPDLRTVSQYADEIMSEIHDDIAGGMVNSHGVTIPKYPGSFSAMHEYTDANCYLLDLFQANEVDSPGARFVFSDKGTETCNAITDECDRRLLAEYLEAFNALKAETGEEFAANCICARGAGHFHAIWPERGCLSPRCPEQAQGAWVGCQGYFRE